MSDGGMTKGMTADFTLVMTSDDDASALSLPLVYQSAAGTVLLVVIAVL